MRSATQLILVLDHDTQGAQILSDLEYGSIAPDMPQTLSYVTKIPCGHSLGREVYFQPGCSSQHT